MDQPTHPTSAERPTRRRRDPGPDDTIEMFRRYRESGDRTLRNTLVEMHLGLADYYVNRYSRSAASSAEDLRQTALLAILKAAERFDPDVGVSFRTFASRTIEGELKRYLRDRSWAVRPPRRAQEMHLSLRRVGEELTHALGRPPTVPELSAALEITEDEVLEALEAGQARSATGLEAPLGGDETAATLAQTLGSTDPAYAIIDDRDIVHDALASLDDRAARVVRLRYLEDMSQPEIAERIGVSQSYVSRILRTSLESLRTELSPR